MGVTPVCFCERERLRLRVIGNMGVLRVLS